MHSNEKVASTHHEYVPPAAAKDPLKGSGYVEKEYEHQEYPKHVGTNAEGKPVVVKSADEEKEYLASKEKADAEGQAEDPEAPAPTETKPKNGWPKK
jgi:hypothetical protein